jgi:hypothetical protein
MIKWEEKWQWLKVAGGLIMALELGYIAWLLRGLHG